MRHRRTAPTALIGSLVLAAALASPVAADGGKRGHGKHDRDQPSRVLIIMLDQARPEEAGRLAPGAIDELVDYGEAARRDGGREVRRALGKSQRQCNEHDEEKTAVLGEADADKSIVYNAKLLTDARARAEQLQQAMATRSVIDQAISESRAALKTQPLP